MKKKREQQEQEKLINNNEEPGTLRQTTIKELIAPSGIDASKIDHLEIISDVKRYARSFFISTLPRMCTFPELFRDLYFFGDINTSLYITPIAESRSQNELNKTIITITHNLEEAVIADRVIVLNNGKIVLDANPKNVLKEKSVLEASGLKLLDCLDLIDELKNKTYNNKEKIEEALWELTFKM